MIRNPENHSFFEKLPRKELVGDYAPPVVLPLSGNLEDFPGIRIASDSETRNILAGEPIYNDQSYEAAAKEINKLAAFYENSLSRLPAGVRNNAEEYLKFTVQSLVRLSGIDRPGLGRQIEEVFQNHSFTFQDTLNFGEAVQQAARSLPDRENIWFIYYPDTNEVVKFVNPAVYELLSRSRMLGLYSFKTLDKLRDWDIKILGASVAAQLIDLLVSLGARNLTIADAGTLEVSNGPRLPSQMADIRNLGNLKLLPLMSGLYGRNPYGNFKMLAGSVVAGNSGLAADGTKIVNAIEFLEGANLLIEVIDSAADKVEIRLALREQGVDVPVVFVVDTADAPMATIETNRHLPFNSTISIDDWRQMQNAMRNSESEIHQVGAALAAVVQMIEPYLPEAHAVIFGQIINGQHPFISQDPGDTRTSASLSSRLIMEMLEGGIEPGRRFTPGELELMLKQRELNRQLILHLLKKSIGIQ